MIDRDSPLSLYGQVKLILQGQIDSGELQPGDPLPPDREICARYGVSQITVTRALRDLARIGVVDRLQGRRTVVAGPKVRRTFDELIGLTETLRRQGLSTHSHVLSRDRVGVEDLPYRPGFGIGNFVRIRRLRFVGERPAVIATSYLPEQLAARLNEYDLEHESFYAMYERALKRRITRREQTMVPIVADAAIASLLGVSKNSAHFCVRGFTYVQDDELIELTESVFHGEIFEFGASMHRVRADAS
jgi:GntR family transcriptional regulator